jgi:hypothetical protein
MDTCICIGRFACSLVSKDSGPTLYYLEWVSENGSLQLVCVVRGSLCPDPEVGVWTRPVVLKTR